MNSFVPEYLHYANVHMPYFPRNMIPDRWLLKTVTQGAVAGMGGSLDGLVSTDSRGSHQLAG